MITIFLHLYMIYFLRITAANSYRSVISYGRGGNSYGRGGNSYGRGRNLENKSYIDAPKLILTSHRRNGIQ
jgi:hypothetical protein